MQRWEELLPVGTLAAMLTQVHRCATRPIVFGASGRAMPNTGAGGEQADKETDPETAFHEFERARECELELELGGMLHPGPSSALMQGSWQELHTVHHDLP